MMRFLLVALLAGCGSQLPVERRFLCGGREVYVAGDGEPEGVGLCSAAPPAWATSARHR